MNPFTLPLLLLVLGIKVGSAESTSPPSAPSAPLSAPTQAGPLGSAPSAAGLSAPPSDQATEAEASGTKAKKKTKPAGANPSQAAGEPKVVITVGPNKIRKSQIDQLVEQMAKAKPAPQEMDPKEREAMGQMIATNLIGQELLELEGKRLGITALDTEVDSMYRGLKANFPDEASWKAALKQAGNSEKLFREKLARQIKADKILNNQIPKLERPTYKEILDYYTANKARFPVNDSLRACQILLLAGKDAKPDAVAKRKADLENLRRELAKDSTDPDRLLANFVGAARQLSEGPEKKDGGDLQRFLPSDFSPEFKKQVGALRVGQMSPVFRTPLGFHLVMLTERFDGKADSYRLVISRAIAAEKSAEAGKQLRKYLQGLASKYKVSYLSPAYRDSSPLGVYNL